jgi:hypothetical protein
MNSVIKKIFRPRREEVTGDCRKFLKEELHDFYSSPNITRVTKSRKMRWADMWHVFGRAEAHKMFWWRSLRKRDHLQDLGIDGRM